MSQGAMREKVLLSWSGGKDSVLTLYEIQKTEDYQIGALLTTVTEGYDRISMHGVRRILLERQAQSLGLSLEEIFISNNATNEEYESKMRDVLTRFKTDGLSAVAFGDIFLQDLREYREGNLARLGIKGIFPIWKRDTAKLARTFVDLGFQAYVTCVDAKLLDQSFVGRIFNEQFLAELPAGIDPCGENGEFHSFVFAGPIFNERISCTIGEVVCRDSFYYCDLLPG